MKRASIRALMLIWLPLAGCATTATPQRYYTLSVDAPAVKQPKVRFPALSVRVERVAASAWLQDQRMCYRLLYNNPAAVAYYRDSRWSAPVPEMLSQFVQDSVAGSGVWRAVIGPRDTARAALDIRIRLLELCQNFRSPQHSTAVFDALVTVVRNDTGAVVAQHEFNQQRPAPTADAAGGVEAERAATAAFAKALVDWLASLDLRGIKPSA